MESVLDTTRAPDRIRQDVSRSPGGDSRVFMNNCIGCHTGMDPMSQAFAYHDYDETSGQLIYTPGTVRPKYFNNSDTFKFGYVTPNDNWDNYWREGPNRWINWDFGPGSPGGSGAGAASLRAAAVDSRRAGSGRREKCESGWVRGWRWSESSSADGGKRWNTFSP